MKKTVFIMLLICVFLLSACGAPDNEAPETTTGTEQTTAAVDLTDEEIYDEFLSWLSSRLSRIIIDDTLLDGFDVLEGMSGVAEIANLRELDMLDKIGYAIVDINEDGTSELLIFDIRKSGDSDINAKGILCAYTVSGNEAILLVEGTSQNCYYLLDDGMILNNNVVDASALNTGVYQLDKEGTQLTCVDYYFAAADDNNQQIWYQNQTGAQDVAASVAVSGGADGFNDIQKELVSRIQTIEAIPFATLEQ